MLVVFFAVRFPGREPGNSWAKMEASTRHTAVQSISGGRSYGNAWLMDRKTPKIEKNLRNNEGT